MEKISLTALARQHLDAARNGNGGRSAHTVFGGHEHALRQTLIALADGNELAEHESPGEATLQVLQGRVRLVALAAVPAAVASPAPAGPATASGPQGSAGSAASAPGSAPTTSPSPPVLTSG